MEHDLPAAWEQLYDRNYSKRELYTLEWGEEVDLEREVLLGAPFGGPVLVTRDEGKLVKLESKETKPHVRIYSSSGRRLCAFLWEKGRLIGRGWTEREECVLVSEQGEVLIYSLRGELQSQFSLGREASQEGVREAYVFGNALVALTAVSYTFLSVPSLTEPRPLRHQSPPLEEPPTSWTVVEPRHTLSHSLEILVATNTGTLWVLCGTEKPVDQLLSSGPFTRLAVSPTGKLLAAFSANGTLHVLSTDFQKNLSQFGCDTRARPKQVAWCGTDSVLLHWDQPRILLMVGPHGDFVNYTYDKPLFLVSEHDGARVISQTSCEFLHKVPKVTEEIFAYGSTTPAATLFDALDDFEKKSPKADEKVRGIAQELTAAVDACIEAAGHEFSHSLQRALLKAASFGKCFLPYYHAGNFVAMCKTLRVLNAVRHYEIGIPLTYEQYKMMKPAVLIDRLINRHRHLLALRICEYLQAPTARVLVHWACSKVQTAADDEALGDLIVQKLQGIPSISYAEIASAAYKYGRPELATKLLDFEARAADQVPLLINMKQAELALRKAIESGDTDLVYLVLLHIKRANNDEFFRILKERRVAQDLFVTYSKQQLAGELAGIYQALGLQRRTAEHHLERAMAEPDLESRIGRLQKLFAFLKSNKSTEYHAKIAEEQVKLLLQQKSLQAELRQPFVGLTVTDTLFRLLSLGQEKNAAKLKKEFGIPDTRYWWVKIRALAQRRDWEGLSRFSKEKKPPIGFVPFVTVCLQQGATNEAAQYIPRISDPHKQVEFLVKIEKFVEAAAIAHKDLKDPNAIQTIRNRAAKAQDRRAVEQCEKLLSSYR